MIEFFKVFSTVTASFLGVMFAFLISKILSVEEKSEELENNLNILKSCIQELKIEINNLGFNKNIYEAILIAEYQDIESKLIELYDNKEEKLKLIERKIKDNDLFFLSPKKTLVFMENHLIDSNFRSLKFKIKLFKISDIKVIESEENKNKFEEVYLLQKIAPIKYNEIKDFIRLYQNNRNLKHKHIETNLNTHKIIPTTKTLFSNNEISKENLKKNLDLYCLKIFSRNDFLIKINFLEKEKKILKTIIIISFVIFLIGIIYPLSYVKFNNENIDFSLHRNFINELCSISGIFLSLITAFVMISFGILYKILCNLKKSNFLKQINEINNLNNEDWIIKNYLEYKEITL
ncbi:MAG: hypothetical protein ACRDCE_08945 [Cetobacterium sp.]|uniref:hypothetical protein n=1 Tax=Cetobacterium sp. TaxID=2071632 RepID=UPI003EE4620E